MKKWIVPLIVCLFTLNSFMDDNTIDEKLVGKWQLVEQSLITVLSDSTQQQSITKVMDGNIKEYRADKSFEITNNSGVYISGVFSCDEDKIFEQIKTSQFEQLNGTTSTLTYTLKKQDRELVVTFKLPGMVNQTFQEVWEKKD